MKGRCKDIPEQFYPFFRTLKPYKGGNELLWALNEICVGDKHRMLTPMGTAALRHHVRVKATGFFRMPVTHIWDRVKQEMELLTVGPDTTGEHDFKFTLFVAFNGIPVIDGQPVDAVLNELVRVVDGIVLGMEAESRRLGFVK
jgi:hypothetical protein